MTSSKYGNVIRVSEIASSPRAGSSLNPGARMAITSGMNNQATTSSIDLRGKQQREDAVGEQSGRRFALAVQMRIGRHEGGVEGALGEDRAKMIGQPQRHEERVRHRPRAENRGEHDVARKSGQPREQRVTADGEDASEHAPLLAHIRETGKSGSYLFRHDLVRKAEGHFR